MTGTVAWHDLECASYSADLPVWESLAQRYGGPVLDLGCGTGRVALHLARRGHQVVGIDRDAPLVEEMLARAEAEALDVGGEAGDARRLDLGRDFPLVLAAMQLVQLVGHRAERGALLQGAAGHVAPGGALALAIVEALPRTDPDARPLPDVLERGGWVLSSLPVALDLSPGRIRVLRLRQAVSPAGELSEERSETELARLDAADLRREAEAHGLVAEETITVPASADHVGSSILTFERAV
ncbi:MAG TPA: class I SAM-dependent methyltransferase [Solirubrobacterales bacterium]|nr:class I SAM-dependent methyltransferase [Solirubrobacterales bacterium]